MQDRRDYLKQYQQKRIAERRAYAVSKLGGVCAKCGATEGLQFDHIDPSTKVTEVARMLTFSMERLEAELAKCQLLCGPCHKHKTAHVDQTHASLRHGTLSAYRYCRCEVCKRAKSEHSRRARGAVVSAAIS